MKIIPVNHPTTHDYDTSTYSMLFFNDYRTLAFYDKGTQLFAYDLSEHMGKRLSVSGGKFHVSDNSSFVGLSPLIYSPSRNYILFDQTSCIIGTGDVRGLTADPDDGTLESTDISNGCEIVLHYSSGNLIIYRPIIACFKYYTITDPL